MIIFYWIYDQHGNTGQGASDKLQAHAMLLDYKTMFGDAWLVEEKND